MTAPGTVTPRRGKTHAVERVWPYEYRVEYREYLTACARVVTGTTGDGPVTCLRCLRATRRPPEAGAPPAVPPGGSGRDGAPGRSGPPLGPAGGAVLGGVEALCAGDGACPDCDEGVVDGRRTHALWLRGLP